MANQNPLDCGVPLFGIDVWEHAYYLQVRPPPSLPSPSVRRQPWPAILSVLARSRSLSPPLFALRACLRLPPQYKNVRPDYVKAIWEIVNWKDVEARFEAASK